MKPPQDSTQGKDKNQTMMFRRFVQRTVRTTPQFTQRLQSFHSNRPAFSGHVLYQHQESPENTADTPFEFNADSKAKIEVVMKKFPTNYKQSAVMPLLYIAQEQGANWLPLRYETCLPYPSPKTHKHPQTTQQRNEQNRRGTGHSSHQGRTIRNFFCITTTCKNYCQDKD